MELPDGWTDGTVYTYLGPDEGGVQHILTVSRDDDLEGRDLAEFAREHIEATVAALAGTETLKDEPKELPDGRTVHEFVCRWIPVDGKAIFRKQVYLVAGGSGFVFAANMTKRTMKTVGVEIERMINSFRAGG